jgi:HK97 family phage major capsid protein
MKTLERFHDGGNISDAAARKVERLIDTNTGDLDGDTIAKRMLVTETDEYRSGWMKTVMGRTGEILPEEARAMTAFRNQGLTDASGGYGVPTLVDPTIILTTMAADVPILRVSRIETITNDVWRGVSSAPASWSFDAENATVSDDSVTLTQPSVTAHKAQGFIPFSIEISMDYPSFAAAMGGLLAQGYTDLLAAATMTGSGSDQPFGIFTAIDATAAREVVVTTSGSLGPVDVYTVWNHLGEAWRQRASWFSSVTVESQIRQSGTDNGFFTTDLTAGGLTQVNGRPWYTTDYAPAFTGTTGTVNLAVVGDFNNYVIAQRAGMSVETVQHLVDVTFNRPTGNRGFYAWARIGADSVNDNGFALLKNAT